MEDILRSERMYLNANLGNAYITTRSQLNSMMNSIEDIMWESEDEKTVSMLSNVLSKLRTYKDQNEKLYNKYLEHEMEVEKSISTILKEKELAM